MSELIEVKTIGEVERIVHGSGLWDGTGPVEFSDDGTTWTEAWAPTPDPQHAGQFLIGHPTYARVSVHRKEVRIPTTVTIRWDEQVPVESEEWSAKWYRSPMRHFGRTGRMVGYRQTFRDLLGDIVIEDEGPRSTPAAPPAGPAPRDWAAEFDAAETIEQLETIVADARKARVFKPNTEGTALDRQWKKLHADLAAAVWEPEAAPELSAGERAQHTAFFDRDTDTHWANGEPRLLTPAAYEREAATFAASPGSIPHVPKPAEPHRRPRPAATKHETSVQAALRDAVLRATAKGDAS